MENKESGLLGFIASPEGQGLLATVFGGLAGARRGEPINSIGRAGMSGIMGYGNALDRNAMTSKNAQALELQKMQIARLNNPVEARTSEQKNWDFGNTLTPEQRTQFMAGNKTNSDPSSVQEWNAYSSMSPEQQQKFREMKRAMPMVDMGGYKAQDLGGGKLGTPIPTTLPPEQTPDHKAAVAAAAAEAQALGAAKGESAVKLKSLESALPGLETVATDLSALGKKATYTIVGQGVDIARRQAGMSSSEGAIARTEYIAKVDNEVLPLLKLTFGSAFTVKEGETLRATLGDPNASPEEKDARLKSFIESKRAQIKGLGGGGAQSTAVDKTPAQTFDAKPPAQQFKGKFVTSPDGKRYQSDGMIWKEVN